ncbi:septation protein SepH [Bifidobacterium sp. ESL0682]|uniref:septation protein SepH n=1 Tax=Bifidobacterium sp. ESL0682 TaxID=2983212 RepID=UPI0023F7532A|nr:septation protein SepH [Bifidobacterium sp. ESL0682]WEV41517.1 septation protein SepH [Bifidobacterium sp. ESL0682]
MPVSSVQEAQFDHVDEDGELVFRARGLEFRVPVDDTLEHAILEARQILSEVREPENPGLAQTLPISSIQALIRAGAQPDKVAEKYGLSQALVRRFSAAVETEKQYAIEQFLSVSAPKGSKVHSVEELIARTLAAARIGMESVTWGATRRGREPWRITATFSTQRNRVRAEWTWNMHDNTVECQNAVAQILLGEGNANQSAAANGKTESQTTSAENGEAGQPAAQNRQPQQAPALSNQPANGVEQAAVTELGGNRQLPGDSVRSARIANTVASMQEQSQRVQPEGNATTATSVNAENQTSQALHENRNTTSAAPSMPSPSATAQTTTSANKQISNATKPTTAPVDAFSLPLPNRTPAEQPKPFNTSNASAQTTGNDSSQTVSDTSSNIPSGASAQKNATDQKEHKQGKRKSGRSAVPSWDEILFGE